MMLSLLYSMESFASCAIQSVTGVSFGAYIPTVATADDSSGNIKVSCTILGIFTTSLSTGSSNTYNPRTLKSGSNTLNYNLYTNSNRTTIWGNGSQGTSTLTSILVLSSINLPVYGRIPALQDVSVGSYTDNIIITVNF